MSINKQAQEPVVYGAGRTKQAFKDQCDITKLMKKAQKSGSLSHLLRHGATYGDFSDVPDLLTAHERIKRGEAIYSELPSELRREFPNMFDFFAFVNDPANADRLQEVMPALAEPGSQAPAVLRSAATEANPALRSAPSDPPQASSGSDAVSEPSSSESSSST